MNLKRFLVISCLSVLSGCATMIASSDAKEPDFSRIKRGTSRAVVEEELGEAVTDIRALRNTNADRKVVYHYHTREKLQQEAGTMTSLGNKMWGVTKHEVTVYYNRNAQVLYYQREEFKRKR